FLVFPSEAYLNDPAVCYMLDGILLCYCIIVTALFFNIKFSHLIKCSELFQYFPKQMVSTFFLQLQLWHLADAFIQSNLHRLIHTLTHRRQSKPCKVTASSSGAVRVKCLAQGHSELWGLN
uniref:Uncharacterized protein n=1 Tax=Gadus morhua TaxID=8049 RepID=A0A8C5AHX8_GADMO